MARGLSQPLHRHSKAVLDQSSANRVPRGAHSVVQAIPHRAQGSAERDRIAHTAIAHQGDAGGVDAEGVGSVVAHGYVSLDIGILLQKRLSSHRYPWRRQSKLPSVSLSLCHSLYKVSVSSA